MNNHATSARWALHVQVDAGRHSDRAEEAICDVKRRATDSYNAEGSGLDVQIFNAVYFRYICDLKSSGGNHEPA